MTTTIINHVWIEVGTLKDNTTVCALLDTGSEITVGKRFLFNWKVLNKPIEIIGVTGHSQQIHEYCIEPEIILGSYKVKINIVYCHDNSGVDLLLGNDFIQLFIYYKQYLYNIQLKTKYQHLITVLKINKP